jgi:hypothetical protein
MKEFKLDEKKFKENDQVSFPKRYLSYQRIVTSWRFIKKCLAKCILANAIKDSIPEEV